MHTFFFLLQISHVSFGLIDCFSLQTIVLKIADMLQKRPGLLTLAWTSGGVGTPLSEQYGDLPLDRVWF